MNTTRQGLVGLTVNGDPHAVPEGTTVSDLVAALDVEPRGVAVAVGGDVVPRSSWPTHQVGPGDAVEILSVAQGG
ncbi:MAG TPA: sulfur carrier protein ThiS [Acidimicrobiales bacterium]